MPVYVGSHSPGGRPGIGVAVERDGALVVGTTAPCPEEPTYLAMAPGGGTLYAVHELADGLVSAFAVVAGGRPRLLGWRRTGAAEPCHVSVHPSGRCVFVSSWGSGSFVVLPVDGDGGLGPPTQVIENPKPYAHMMVSDPGGRWVLGVHMAAGTVSSYEPDLDAGRLRFRHEAEMAAGAGPRHLALHPAGEVVYVVNELNSTLTACDFDSESGRLDRGESISTVPPDSTGDNFPSAVRASPDGRFVYVANRGHDSIAVISTQPRPRLLATFPSGGEFPRDIALGAEGRLLYVANERSDLITVLAVDPSNGGLALTGQALAFPGPTCLLPI
jgi:6-phosphogluconolactonase